jgi:DNA polymerase III sliding clamp (beta) subunit (PCNA family)
MKTATLINALTNVAQINGDILIENGKVSCSDGHTFIQVVADIDLPTMLVDKSFLKLIEKLPEAEISLGRKLKIQYGSSKVELPIRDPIMFQNVTGVEKLNSCAVNTDLFKTALSKVLPFAGEENFGVVGMFPYGLASTDTQCIAEFRMPCIEATLPKQIVPILIRSLAGNAIIATDGKGISFESGNFFISTPQHSSKFPSYTKFLRAQGLTFTVERAILIESLRRVLTIVQEENTPVKLDINNGLTLSSETQFGSISETIPVSGEGQYTAYFSAKKLLYTVEKLKSQKLTLKVDPDFIIRDSEEEFVLLNRLNVAHE